MFKILVKYLFYLKVLWLQFNRWIQTSLGVIFDQPLLSGNNMNGKLNSNRGLIIDSSLVLNLTNKQFVYHSSCIKNRKKLTDEEKLRN